MAERGSEKPSRVDEVNPTGLPLGPLEGHVLSQIDGHATVEDIAFIVGQPLAAVEAAVARLEQLGAISVDRVQLDAARQARISALYGRLDRLTHYELLGVPTHADKAAIRAAYFALTKEVHPDTLYGKQLGRFQGMMETIFRHATEAYEVLSASKRRAPYDATLGLPPLAARAPAPRPPSAAAPARDEAQRAASRARIAAQLRALTTPPPPRPSAIPRRDSGVIAKPDAPEAPIDYELRARAEQQRQAWAEAALSWAKVAEARPDDPTPLREAARCLLEGRGDLRRARDLAREATRRDPKDLPSRVLLAEIYQAAGMRQSARAELLIAAKLDSKAEIVKNLLREFGD